MRKPTMRSLSWSSLQLIVTALVALPAQSLRADLPFAASEDISNGSVLGITSLVAGDINGDELVDVIAIEGGKHANGRKTFAWFEALWAEASSGSERSGNAPIARAQSERRGACQVCSPGRNAPRSISA